jgi:hypothetical protein
VQAAAPALLDGRLLRLVRLARGGAACAHDLIQPHTAGGRDKGVPHIGRVQHKLNVLDAARGALDGLEGDLGGRERGGSEEGRGARAKGAGIIYCQGLEWLSVGTQEGVRGVQGLFQAGNDTGAKPTRLPGPHLCSLFLGVSVHAGADGRERNVLEPVLVGQLQGAPAGPSGGDR